MVYCVENEFCFFELNFSDVSRASVTVILLFFLEMFICCLLISQKSMIYFSIKQQFKAFKGQRREQINKII